MTLESNLISDVNNSTGWHATLDLELINRFGKTVMGRCSRKGPLTFQRPFYPENEVCHLYLLHPPGGIVGSDEIHLDIRLNPDTHNLVTTPGATKFYRSAGDLAIQNQGFSIDDSAVLEWFPQETILFPGAKAKLSTRIDLTGTARFFGWEILCFGRPVNDIKFDTGSIQNRVSVFRDGKPLFIEHLMMNPDDESGKILENKTGFAHYPVTGTFLATGVDDVTEQSLELESFKHIGQSLAGVTRNRDILVARYLGFDPEEAKQYFTGLWTQLRKILIKKDRCLPRIWDT